MPPPFELERGDPHHKAAPNKSLLAEPVSRTVYRQDSRTASDGRVIRLDSLDSPEDRALRRVCQEVREQPQRLPLAAHRVGALVNAGRLPYRWSWDSLFYAALDAGASEAWTLRCVYSGFAQSNVSELPSPALWALVNGGVQ
jgi:hypothetical protein